MLFVMAAAAAAMMTTGCAKVDTGERGFKVAFGEVISVKPLTEGLYFYNVFTTDLITYDCRNQRAVVKQECFTKDVQYVKIDLSVTYTLNPDKVIELHKETGPNFASIIIEPAVLGALKDVSGNWEAGEIPANRAKMTDAIQRELTQKLVRYGINVTFVEMLNIDFSDEFEKAVEAKQIAMQNAIKAKNETARIKEEANQKLVSAEAEAKSMAIRAEALAKNKSLVEFEAVQKWDGKLPHYLMGNTIPFINIDKH